eukprot:XP_011663307.1 PREDICTED: uncharacterized protein LOC105437878 [Strongylocentrotus purpuratus]
MFIPPEAVRQSDPCKITLTLLRDIPSVDIQDDSSVSCYGIRCDPPNMIFHRPVKIRIPHATLAISPYQVKPDIVSHVWDSVNDIPRTSRMRSSSSPDEPPYCRVFKRHLELYIGHCAEWWVLIPLEQQVIRHQLMCTPYIPETVARGKEIEVHLHMHADLPGIEMDIQEEEKQQSYQKKHRSVPFSVESKSGDVTVTCHREGKRVESKVLSLKDVYGKMRHNILFFVTPTEDDVHFAEITISITQAGRLGVSRSVAFIVRHADGLEYVPPFEALSFFRAVEKVLKSDLPDIDVLTIAQTMTIDQFYDLGIALGFTVQQLDVIEYRRFRDREQAIYDMLVTWRERQPPGQAAKETILSLMESLDSPTEEMFISDIGLTGEIPDWTLLAFARQIRPKKFYEIGGKLGFNTSELQHIEHRILYNRKDANIQLLSSWKAAQTSGPKAKQTLKLVWESVQDASKSEKTKGSGLTGINFPQQIEAVQGPTGGQTMTQEPTSAIDQPLLDETSSKNQGNMASGDMDQHSEEVSHHITADLDSTCNSISSVGKKVHWDFLTESPQELTLQDNEVVISCGIRFSPSGAKLNETIKVTLDHNAHFTNPRRAEIVFYTRNKDATSFVRIPAFTNGCPRCDVRSKDLDLYVDHFSDWWIVALITRYFVGKRVWCGPYVLPPVKKGFTHLVLLCIYDDLLDVIEVRQR